MTISKSDELSLCEGEKGENYLNQLGRFVPLETYNVSIAMFVDQCQQSPWVEGGILCPSLMISQDVVECI